MSPSQTCGFLPAWLAPVYAASILTSPLLSSRRVPPFSSICRTASTAVDARSPRSSPDRERSDDEYEAFRAFACLYPDTVLLADTYDTLAGVRKVVKLAKEFGPACVPRGALA